MNTPLTEAEWKIMLKLWEHSPQTMMELTRALEPETAWSKHTVITMLKRMQLKGTVQINDEKPVKTYTPAVAKERIAREQTSTLLTRLFSGRASLLVNNMVEQGELNDAELAELREILDKAEQKKNKP
ncbi:MAG: BlaI/MecI/CopY family transcriptional regulator [Clostridia bacterium]